jgi:hypothetical protein
MILDALEDPNKKIDQSRKSAVILEDIPIQKSPISHLTSDQITKHDSLSKFDHKKSTADIFTSIRTLSPLPKTRKTD